MGRKKIDSRIKILIENCVKQRHRSFFVIVGDEAKEQVVNINYILTKSKGKAKVNVLWCYKKNLGFTSDDRSRAKQLKFSQATKGSNEENEGLLDDAFHLFLAATDIRFCYFKDTQSILGNTYGMLVIQDFESITPNVLARTIETVEGGGAVILLLPGMSSLKQLYTMAMDVHSRFRSDPDEIVTPRFNERFLLSLSTCQNSLVLDDKLNILPLSSHIKNIKPIVIGNNEVTEYDSIRTESEKELIELKKSLKETKFVGTLVDKARTLDQAKAILQFIEAISEKSLQASVALTAARGRGKSAALGIAIASAVAYGYSNIFVTSPSPENLNTLFEFVTKGLNALDYKEQTDYELVQSANPSFNKAIVRINIFKDHRQTIQYIQPHDWQKLGQAELLVIDEAAAIPLPLVKKLLGPYLIFIASTINGYEGTGRSLSLKLIQKMKEKSQQRTGSERSRSFYEVVLEEPIRYAAKDAVETWLYKLLCLDATSATPITSKCPHPNDCSLYYVNRDTLFSFHDACEAFLHNMMTLFVSSHYKNSPNDLQLMADAPSHHLFVLLGPIDENTTDLPDIYCVIQVAMEGKINQRIMMQNLSKGQLPSGDLLPYLVSKQYQSPDFGSISGARIVRVATHPDYQRMGYGTRALELITQYYQKELQNLEEEDDEENDMEEKEQLTTKSKSNQTDINLLNEEIIPRSRTSLPPLLQSLDERAPEDLQYLGVSYGVTQKLFNYWKKGGFQPVYIRRTENELTGEHTCAMLRPLKISSSENIKMIQSFTNDFKRRLLTLLAYEFRTFAPSLCLSLLDFRQMKDEDVQANHISPQELDIYFSSFDIKRMDAYVRNLVDHNVILDLLPHIARLFFLGRFPFSVSFSQAAVIISLGLQHKKIEEVEEELEMKSNQILALFMKFMKKVVKYLKDVEKLRLTQSELREDKKTRRTTSSSNVTIDELEITTDDMKKSKKSDKMDLSQEKEIMEIFASTNSTKDEGNEQNKPQNQEEDSDEESGHDDDDEKQQNKKRKLDLDHKAKKQITKYIMNNADQYKLSSDLLGGDEKIMEQMGDEEKLKASDGVLSVTVQNEQKIKPYMLKNKKKTEKQMQEQKNHQEFKKGGKRKRKIKV